MVFYITYYVTHNMENFPKVNGWQPNRYGHKQNVFVDNDKLRYGNDELQRGLLNCTSTRLEYKK